MDMYAAFTRSINHFTSRYRYIFMILRIINITSLAMHLVILNSSIS